MLTIGWWLLVGIAAGRTEPICMTRSAPCPGHAPPTAAALAVAMILPVAIAVAIPTVTWGLAGRALVAGCILAVVTYAGARASVSWCPDTYVDCAYRPLSTLILPFGVPLLGAFGLGAIYARRTGLGLAPVLVAAGVATVTVSLAWIPEVVRGSDVDEEAFVWLYLFWPVMLIFMGVPMVISATIGAVLGAPKNDWSDFGDPAGTSAARSG